MLIGQVSLVVEIICQICESTFLYEADTFMDVATIENEMQSVYHWGNINDQLICPYCRNNAETA